MPLSQTITDRGYPRAARGTVVGADNRTLLRPIGRAEFQFRARHAVRSEPYGQAMGEPVDVGWPAPAMATARLTIRPTEVRDRPHCIELLCSPEVRRILGGPVDRALAESETHEVVIDRSGVFAVEKNGRFLGTVMVDRRPASRPGHVSPEGFELEVSYTFLPEA